METLKKLMAELLTTVVFPAMDKAVVAWNTPFQIDDFLWMNLKAKIQEKLDLLSVELDESGVYRFVSSSGQSSDSILQVGAFSLKDLLKTFVATYVFPEIDAYVQNLKIPFNLDDKLWAILKAKIIEELDKVDFAKEAMSAES